MKIYSWRKTESGYEYVGTEATDWRRVQDCAVVRNPVLGCYHVADYATGAIVATVVRRSEAERIARRGRWRLPKELSACAETAILLAPEVFFGAFQLRKEP